MIVRYAGHIGCWMGRAMTPSHLARLRDSLEDGEPVSDRAFDALYPPRVRRLSSTFWTPVRVAQRAIRLLAPSPGARVLDVGLGAGKFCVVAAACARAEITGIEQREHLVRVSKSAARRLGVRARFVHGDLSSIDWTSFDAFYFYNPFHENIEDRGARIDDVVELSHRRFVDDVERTREALAAARAGTRVVTYHGLGADLPRSYRLAAAECAGSDSLKLFIKASPAAVDAVEMLPSARSEAPNATL